jgi:hypothetical protein
LFTLNNLQSTKLNLGFFLTGLLTVWFFWTGVKQNDTN